MPELKPTEAEQTESLAAICLLFGLRYSEGLMLLSLLSHGLRTKDELRATIAQEVVATSTMSVTLHTLRRKLQPRGIKIINVSKVGYMIDTKARDKILKLLAEHDAGIAASRLKPKLDLNLNQRS